jgi:hypothetical protein
VTVDAGSDAGVDAGVFDGGTAPTITTTSPLATLTGGTAATAFTFTATGDAPITWTLTAGMLPPGMALAANGVACSVPNPPPPLRIAPPLPMTVGIAP